MITSGADGLIVIWRLPTTQSEDTSVASVAMEKISQLPKIPEMLVAKNDIAVRDQLESSLKYS